MWYDSSMPNQLPTAALEKAAAAVSFARQVRAFHRRRTDVRSTQRLDDLNAALDRIAEAMRPIRSEIGRFPYGPQTEQAERNRQQIRDLSEQLQRERRKVWKMRQRSLTE